MNTEVSWAALIATIFAAAGFIVWQFYAYLASTLPLPGASHVLDLANEALAIGIVALVVAIIFWILALRE